MQNDFSHHFLYLAAILRQLIKYQRTPN